MTTTHTFTKALLRTVYTFVILSLILATVLACGSDDNDDQQSASSNNEINIDESAVVAIGDRPEISAQTRQSAIYSYQDFIDAGWKQYQIYDIDTLPDAIAARYGFFQRRDIEIRQYPSHDIAMRSGVISADEAIERTVHDGSGFASRRVYGGYLVAGNMLMLCEVSVSDCTALVNAVESSKP